MKKFVGEIINIILTILGILSAGMGLKGFLLSSRFIDGGVTGISMLIAEVFHLPLSVLLLIFNLPFIALGYKQVGAKFAVKSAVAIAGLAVALIVIPYPDVTPDKLLTAVFGGFFIGAGIGLAMRGGAVLDGDGSRANVNCRIPRGTFRFENRVEFRFVIVRKKDVVMRQKRKFFLCSEQ